MRHQGDWVPAVEPKIRLMGNAAYIGFFGVAGVALMVYFAATTRSPWIRFASAAAGIYFAAVLVLVGMVVAHALKRADRGFILDLRFRRKITLTTVAAMMALSASLFVASALLNESIVGEAILGTVAALLAVALVLGTRDYRREFLRRGGP